MYVFCFLEKYNYVLFMMLQLILYKFNKVFFLDFEFLYIIIVSYLMSNFNKLKNKMLILFLNNFKFL